MTHPAAPHPPGAGPRHTRQEAPVRVYATPADLVEYQTGVRPTDEPTDPAQTTLLRRASVAVDRLLRTAVYDTDQDGLPTAQPVVDALRDATCAQAVYFTETGDISGAGARFSGISLGAFSASGGSVSGSTKDDARTSPEAVDILTNAGLLSAKVRGR